MYEFIEYTVLILLYVFVIVNTFKQVKGGKIKIGRKKVASATLTIAGFLIFIWSLVHVIQTVQANIIKVSLLDYLNIIMTAACFIVGIYLLIYCKKLEKQ